MGSELIGVRVPPDLLAEIDAWIAERKANFNEHLSRPDALRRLAHDALKVRKP